MKKLYITVVSTTGNRQNVKFDMPTERPRRSDFDQHAILRGAYEVHLYAQGMDYSEQETAALVTTMLNEPLTRAAALGRPLPLDTDFKFPLVLISDEFNAPSILIAKARMVGDTDDVEILNQPISAPRSVYPLSLIFDVYRAAHFVIHEIPHEATEAAPTSSGYVAVHESVGAEWQPIAAAFLEWLYKQR